jgi:hypothetical protein
MFSLRHLFVTIGTYGSKFLSRVALNEGYKFQYLGAVLRIRIRIDFGVGWIRIRIGNADPDPGEQKLPTKSAGCSLFWRLQGFPLSLDVFYGGLRISPVNCNF